MWSVFVEVLTFVVHFFGLVGSDLQVGDARTGTVEVSALYNTDQVLWVFALSSSMFLAGAYAGCRR